MKVLLFWALVTRNGTFCEINQAGTTDIGVSFTVPGVTVGHYA